MFVVQQAQGIAKSGVTLRQAQGKRAKYKICALISAKNKFYSFWLASVQHFDKLRAGIESFGFVIRHYRQYVPRYMK